jgi:hypothetical protein
MSESALTTQLGSVPISDPIALIEGSGKVASTRRPYTRVLAPHLAQGGNLTDVAALKVYAETR